MLFVGLCRVDQNSVQMCKVMQGCMVQCALGSVRWAVCVGKCALGSVRWALCVGHCALGSVRREVYVGTSTQFYDFN